MSSVLKQANIRTNKSLSPISESLLTKYIRYKTSQHIEQLQITKKSLYFLNLFFSLSTKPKIPITSSGCLSPHQDVF